MKFTIRSMGLGLEALEALLLDGEVREDGLLLRRGRRDGRVRALLPLEGLAGWVLDILRIRAKVKI